MWKKQNSAVFRWVVVGMVLLCPLLTAGCGNHGYRENSRYEMERQYQLERQKRVDPHGHLQDEWGQWQF